MNEHKELIQEAEDSISKLFNDKTVSQSETAADLRNLQSFIDIMLGTLDD